MRAKTAFTALSWTFVTSGLLGLANYVLSSSFEPVNPAPALCLLALGFAGLGFRAYLDFLQAVHGVDDLADPPASAATQEW